MKEKKAVQEDAQHVKIDEILNMKPKNGTKKNVI